MFPRASNTQKLSTSPTIIMSLQSSSTAAVPAVTANLGAATTGAGVLGAGLLGFDGTNWQKVLTQLGAESSNTGVFGAAPLLFDTANNSFYRTLTARSLGDNITGDTLGVNALMLDNGAGRFDRARNSSASFMAATTQPFSLKVDPPGQWSQAHTPVAATQATTSKAAGAAGVRHLCNSISFSVGDVAAIAAVQVNLRDGASGAGTVLWSMTVMTPAGAFVQVALGDLNIIGSAATAMTLEFSAAPAATGIQSVAMTGHSVV